jgi:hypothetical protein
VRSPLRSRRRGLSNHRAAQCDLLTLHAPFGPTDDVRDLLRIACDWPRRWHASDGNPRTKNHDESAISEMGQGRLWPTGEWHSRSTPSSGNARAFPHLRFVPISDIRRLACDFEKLFLSNLTMRWPCAVLAAI